MYICGKYGIKSFISDGRTCTLSDDKGVVIAPELPDDVHLFANKYIVCGSRLEVAVYKAVIGGFNFDFKFDVSHIKRYAVCKATQNLTVNMLDQRVGRRYNTYVDFLRLIVSSRSLSSRFRFISYEINDKLKRNIWFRVIKSDFDLCYILPVPIEFIYNLYYSEKKYEILKEVCPLLGVECIKLEDSVLLKQINYPVLWEE